MTAITKFEFSAAKWRTVSLATLAIWLGGSLVLDTVLMPTLSSAGMMTQPGFASAGYSLFWIFNHLEMLCAALILTSLLVMQNAGSRVSRWVLPAAVGLLAITLADTYSLTPMMSALGLQLDFFAATTPMPAEMNQLHAGYWLLEALKFGLGSAVLAETYRSVNRQSNLA